MRKLAYVSNIEEVLEDEDVKQALICSECGVCEDFACPMGLHPRKINQLLKTAYGERGIRYCSEKPVKDVDVMRSYRLIPSKRIAARVGVDKFYDCSIHDSISGEVLCVDAEKIVIAKGKM